MTWVRFDDMFPIHRKVGALSDAAFRLHVEAVCWCARHLTDGVVSSTDLAQVTRTRKPQRLVTELVRSGAWREAADGWQIHDYLEYQPSRSKVTVQRQAKAERQARWLAKKKTKGRDASQDESIDASKDDAPSPTPPRPEGGGSGGSRSATGRQRADGAAGDEQQRQQRAAANQATITNCAMCDHHGYNAGRVCTHDPEQPTRARVGAAQARAQLGKHRRNEETS